MTPSSAFVSNGTRTLVGIDSVATKDDHEREVHVRRAMSNTRRTAAGLAAMSLVMAITLVVFALVTVYSLVETQLSPSALLAIGKVTSYFVSISSALALAFTGLCFPRITRPYAMTASAIAMLGGLAYALLALTRGAPLIGASFIFLFGFAFVGLMAALGAVLVGIVVWFVQRNR
jgi:hypothetical protein